MNNWLNSEFPYLFNNIYEHFSQIQYLFKVLKTDFTIQYFQYRVGTLYFTDVIRENSWQTQQQPLLHKVVPDQESNRLFSTSNLDIEREVMES